MKKVIVSAKTLDEAITKGCAELGVDMADVDFNVLEDGGVFHKMQVEVSVKAAEATTPADTDHAITDGAVEEFEIVGVAKPSKPEKTPLPVTEFDPECPKFKKTLAFAEQFFPLLADGLTVSSSHDDREFVINVHGEEVSRLIGKGGRTLAAINILVNAIAVNTHSGEPRRVVVDIEDYRERRRESLINLAKRKAEQVKNTGRAVKLDPMPARERVIVHTALQDVEGIITQSEGVEPQRYLVIKPGAR